MRLALLKPALSERAAAQWSTHARHTGRILDVVQGELTWIIGTIYMEMALKPHVLQDLAADIDLAAAIPSQPWRDPRKDTIQLEDESGRIRVIGNALTSRLLCTGIVVAMLGSETSSEEFEVIDVLFAGAAPSACSPDRVRSMSRPIDHPKDAVAPEYAVLVSGLEIDGSEGSNVAISMLTEYLSGELLDLPLAETMKHTSTLIIAGNSINSAPIIQDDAMSRKQNKNKKYGYDSALFNPRPVMILDRLVEDLVQTLNVVILPGDKDPTNATMPQQSISSIMLRNSARYCGKGLELLTNPSYLKIKGRLLFGTAGQTIDDIAHYITTAPFDETAFPDQAELTEEADPMDIIEGTLHWRHFAPTAPDTLWTYPFADRDPFIVETCPDIYFVGNQECFASRLVEVNADAEKSGTCRLISLPRFAKTGQIVRLNLDTLDAECVQLTMTCPK